MKPNELVLIAAQVAANWMPIWTLYLFVIGAVMTAMVALKDQLSQVALTVGFVLFAVAHIVTVHRHYAQFSAIRAASNQQSDAAAKAIIDSLAPVDWWLVVVVYVASVGLVVGTLYRFACAQPTDPSP